MTAFRVRRNNGFGLTERLLRLTSVNSLFTLDEMIRSFRHKGLEQFFKTGSKAGIKPSHAARLRLQLARLDGAKSPSDMALPGWRAHQLTTGHWSVWGNGNWRVTFAFEGEDAVLVDYRDYH